MGGRGAIRKEVQVHVKFSSMQASSASLPIRSPRFSLPHRRPTRDERRGTRAAEQSARASNPLCPPLAAEPRRGEAAKTKAVEPRMRGRLRSGERSAESWAGGRRAGSARLSSPSKIYLEERGFTRSASPRGSGGRKVFFSSSSSSSSCSPTKTRRNHLRSCWWRASDRDRG